jgi:hypothetical protein
VNGFHLVDLPPDSPIITTELVNSSKPTVNAPSGRCFVRIVSNPTFSPNAVSPEQATFLLTNNLKDAHHLFWHDAIAYVEAVTLFNAKILGHR